MMLRQNRSHGFTLLEVMIVSGLMSTLAVLLASAWAGIGRTAADLVGRCQLVQERDLAVMALCRDLSGGLGTPDRSGEKHLGQLLRWDQPANSEQSLNTDLRLLYNGQTDPHLPVTWAPPNTIIRYMVESNCLVRWDEFADTKFVVARNVESMMITGIDGRPDAFNIVLCFKYRNCVLTCDLTVEIP